MAKAVSYTHLDVYKRQGTNGNSQFGACDSGEEDCCESFTGRCQKERDSIWPSDSGGNFGITWIGTVSYTHLEQIKIDGENYQVGHTKEYVKVALKTEANLQNKLVDIQIDNHSQIIHWISQKIILK